MKYIPNPQLIDALVYFVVLMATCSAVAILMYRAVKSGAKARGNGLTLGPLTISFELTGGIAGFFIILCMWLYFLPPSTVLPRALIYTFDGHVDVSKVPADAIRVTIEPPNAELLSDGRLIVPFLVQKRSDETWDFPNIVLKPRWPQRHNFTPVPIATDPSAADFLENPVELESGRTLHMVGDKKISLPVLQPQQLHVQR
jgi:hypothetical protein